MRKAQKLTDAERSELQILHDKGYSARSIAKVLGRSPNTIATELQRNSYQADRRTPPDKQGSYVAAYAKQKAYIRRRYATYQGRKIQGNDELRSFIVLKLSEHWNPDEISGYLKLHPEQGYYASKTAIYEWLHSAYGQPYCEHLASHRYAKRKRKAKAPQRVMISGRIGIEQRPAVVDTRSWPGHWEGDTLVSGKRTRSLGAVAVLQERTTRLLVARSLPNLKPDVFAAAATVALHGKQATTLTLDNGIENRHWQTIAAATGAEVYFCDPYSSWQKGSIENANKMLRRYLPKEIGRAHV